MYTSSTMGCILKKLSFFFNLHAQQYPFIKTIRNMITLEKLCDDDTGINKNKCHNSLTRMQLYVCICVTAGAHTNTCICVFFHTIKLKVYYIHHLRKCFQTQREREHLINVLHVNWLAKHHVRDFYLVESGVPWHLPLAIGNSK